MHSLKDVFEFSDTLDQLNFSDSCMVSYNVSSLLTNVPIEETIDIICEHADNTKLPPAVLKELLSLCTENTNFIFDSVVYRPIDGVAVGSPLGPILANIFMTTLEKQRKMDDIIAKKTYYKRYVDDTFVLCKNRTDAESILNEINAPHPNIHFTMECEQSNTLSFFDLKIRRLQDGSIEKTIYHKPTWSGQYFNFSSFSSIQYKKALSKLLHTAYIGYVLKM